MSNYIVKSNCKECSHSAVCRYASAKQDFEKDVEHFFSERVSRMDNKELFACVFSCTMFSQKQRCGENTCASLASYSL